MNDVLDNCLKLIRMTIDSTSTEHPDLSNWPEIKKELEMQTILPFVSEAALSCNLNENQQNEVITAMGANIQHFYAYMAEQDQLIKLLEANNIPCAIMKGAAAAQYYPNPDLRAMGDIDILVLPEDFERAFHLLCESGYRNIEELDHFDPRHIEFISKAGQMIELHRYFSSSFNKEQNKLLDQWLFGQLKNLKKVDICGYQVPILPTVENGLILLGHINQHLNEGLGFRQIIDWMLFVEKELNDHVWNQEFKAKAESIGMAKLAITVTKMCQKYLGLSTKVSWSAEAEDELVDRFLNYVSNKGNFGCKSEHLVQRTKTITHFFFNPVNIFRYLSNTGMVNMYKAGKKPRKSVAWLYQIGHLVCMTVKHKDEVDLFDNMKRGKEENVFLQKLGVMK